MKRVAGTFATVLLLFIGVYLSPPAINPANSQLTIQLGGDFGRAKQNLIAQGYSQIEMVGQGFTKFQVEACHTGVRYWFKSDSLGRINQKRQIGTCQTTVNIEQVQQILASQGYSRINVEDRGGRYLAVACLGDDRMRIAVNNLGQIGKRRILGTCRQSLTPADVTVELQKQGYTRIKFTNRKPPVYGVEACLGKRNYRLEVDQFAKTLSENRIGDCRGPIDPRQLADFLQNSGYTRVVVIDDRLPRYVAEVCSKADRLELTLNRYGDIIDRYKTGQCYNRVDRRQLVRAMAKQGYVRIDVKRENRRGYVVEACYTGQLIRADFNIYGELVKEQSLGECPRWSIADVTNQMSQSKYKGIKFYADGCRKGKLYRFLVNEFGDRSERKVIGNCK